MNEKLVSIIMPVFNAECYLKQAVESILNQTYQNIELLVIDDKSTDNTINILNEYRNVDKRIKVIQKTCHVGIAEALNTGIDMADGEYIARMDADDISLKERIEKQVAFMNQNSDIGICSTQMQLLWEDGTITDISDYPSDSQKIKARFLIDNGIAHPTVMFRANIIKHRWKYRTMPSEDYDLWTRMAVSEEFACIPDRLLYYRMHQKNTSKVIEYQTLLKANNQIVKRYMERLLNIKVSKYRQDDFYISIDRMLVDESVYDYMFRQYQLLKELYVKNQEMAVFDNSIMWEIICERWKLAFKMFEFDSKIVSTECDWNLDVWFRETDLIVKNRLRDIFEYIRKLLMNHKKIVIYGLGEYGTNLFVDWKCAKELHKTNWELVGLIDKNKELIEIEKECFLINKPSVLLESDFDFILVSSKKFFTEIKDELLMMGIHEGKILYGGRIFRICRNEVET